MKNTLVILILFVSVAASAQIRNVRLGVGGNASFIPSIESKSEVNLNLPYSVSSGYYSYAPTSAVAISTSFKALAGVALSGSFEIPISPKFFFSTGLSFSWLRFQGTTRVESITEPQAPAIDFNDRPTLPGAVKWVGPGVPFGVIHSYPTPRLGEPIPLMEESEDKGKSTLVAMQIPVLAGTSFFKNKMSVKTGFVTSFLLGAKTNNGFLSDNEMENTTDRFSRVSVGAMLSADYKLYRMVNIEVSAQHYFTPLFDDQPENTETARLNVVSVGLTYKIRN